MKSFQIVRTALFVIVSSLFISCEDNTGEGLELSFDMNLPKDKNGYYHLTLDITTGRHYTESVPQYVIKN